MWCKICGGEIYPGIESVNGTHADADYCVVILNARVEHEEARAIADERRVAELEARLAELEARLAELGVEQDEYNPEDDPIWQQADAAYERVTGIFTPPPAATE